MASMEFGTSKFTYTKMKDQIINFNKQFEFEPEIINSADLNFDNYLVCGMGGSHLGADFLQSKYSDKNISIHSDYLLPPIVDSKTLIIISSFSGNTEEAISSYKEARQRDLHTLAIASGGELLRLAIAENIPYIKLPALDIQPRMAFGYSLKAFAKAMDIKIELNNFNPVDYEKHGQNIADKIFGKIPLIYTDTSNAFLAKHWKIKLNETSKSPAFYNVIPEMNHNEINMFQQFSTDKPSPFVVLFLRHSGQSARISQRIDIMQKILSEHGTDFIDIKFTDHIANICLSDWTSYHLALKSGVDPESIPIIESLKKSL